MTRIRMNTRRVRRGWQLARNWIDAAFKTVYWIGAAIINVALVF
jgi:hypothetical protein